MTANCYQGDAKETDAQPENPPRFGDELPGCDVNVPEGFTLTRDGVAKCSEKGDVFIAGPVWVAAYARDARNGSWGLLVRWLDRDGHQHEQAIPKARLHESSPVLAQELARDGLHIVPGKEKVLAVYLAAFEPKARLRSVVRLGWMDEPDAGLVYVLPKENLAKAAAPEVIYLPERASPSASTIYANGRLEDWKRDVAAACVGNPLLIFSACVALAAPLLRPARLDGGGFHLYGGSSRGKTTALQVGASVWGSGADPAEAPGNAYIHRWNATRNGLEGLASAHNDGLLALDELGSCDAEDFGRIIYDLAGGQGKAAMDANRALKEKRAWRNMILSTGEVSGTSKIEEGRRSARAGQRLRLMDVPITDGIIVNTRGREAGAYANDLKRACARSFGVAGPAFVHALVSAFEHSGELSGYVTACLDQWTAKLSPSGGAAEHQRAVRRFALVTVAGLMAQEHDVLPASVDVVGSVRAVCRGWFADASNAPEATRGVEAVRAFVMANPDRFRQAISATPLRTVRNLCGYTTKEPNLYLFTDEGFNEACGGHEPKVVAAELARLGLLYMNESRYKSRHRVDFDGTAKRVRFIAVKSAILEIDTDIRERSGGTTGTTGQCAQIQNVIPSNARDAS